MRIRNSKKPKIIAVLLIIIISMSVGYAFLSATLSAVGNATFKKQDLLVYFTNIQTTTGSVTPTTAPTTSGIFTNSLTWSVCLDAEGEFYEFTVDVVNAGLNDAMIESLLTSPLTVDQAKYLDYTVKYSDGIEMELYDKLAAGETETLKVRVEYKENVPAADIPAEPETITITYALAYVLANGNAKERNLPVVPLQIGDEITYTTSLNSTEYTANWKVFNQNDDYVWLITSEILPNSYVNIDNISESETDYVNSNYGEGREILINAITNETNWNSLLAGEINGKSFDFSNDNDVNTTAAGSPSLELFIESWNKQHPDNKLYTAKTSEAMSDGLYGYYLGISENPSTVSADLGTFDRLYVLSQKNYWLSSPSGVNDWNIMSIGYDGKTLNAVHYASNIGLRPVICIPKSVLE